MTKTFFLQNKKLTLEIGKLTSWNYDISFTNRIRSNMRRIELYLWFFYITLWIKEV